MHTETEPVPTINPALAAKYACVRCGVPVQIRRRYCAACRIIRGREASARLRAGINFAPGESSVRCYAVRDLKDVAKELQVSRQRVQQIERVAVVKLRRALLPLLAEHDAAFYQRVKARTTAGQEFLSRTSQARNMLSARQRMVVAQLKELAGEYEADGQPEVAAEIREEVRRLETQIARLLRNGKVA